MNTNGNGNTDWEIPADPGRPEKHGVRRFR